MSLPVAPLIDGKQGNDPRGPSQHDTGAGTVFSTPPLHATRTHDPSVTFEEYMYYAQVTRADEMANDGRYRGSRGKTTWKSLIKDRFSKGHHDNTSPSGPAEKTTSNTGDIMTGPTAADWKEGSRAIRTAGWGGVFYLITTDILGPFSTP